MKISLRRVNVFRDDFGKIRKLYKNAFPADERAPMWLLTAKSRQENADFWSLFADGKWFGMAYVVSDRDMSYLFYLAVSEERRGIGLGSGALRALMKMYHGRRFFIALEPLDSSADNYPQRLARRAFYVKNGLKPLPGRIREARVYYDVMGIGGELTPGEYERMMRNYFGFPIGKMVAMEFD